MASAKVCVICRFEDWNSEKPFHILYEKGAALLNRAILARQDDLEKVSVGQMVHECWRKDYCSEKSIKQKWTKMKVAHHKIVSLVFELVLKLLVFRWRDFAFCAVNASSIFQEEKSARNFFCKDRRVWQVD